MRIATTFFLAVTLAGCVPAKASFGGKVVHGDPAALQTSP